MFDRALVLGGGGFIGVAWESGVVAGLQEAGVDLRACDAFVGTSAGAIVCARLAAGKSPPQPSDPPVPGSERLVVDPATLDVQALTLIFGVWSKKQALSKADAREIGALSRGLYGEREPHWVEGMTALIGTNIWPEVPLLVSAVDTEEGERAVFDASMDIPLGRAVAASAAVPGLFPNVAIRGRLYMDGQVLSSTHADLLLTHARVTRTCEAIVIMPTNRFTSPEIGTQSELAAAREIAELEAAGHRVHFITPSAEETQRLGTNLMDSTKTSDAFATGVDTGRAWAPKLTQQRRR